MVASSASSAPASAAAGPLSTRVSRVSASRVSSCEDAAYSDSIVGTGASSEATAADSGSDGALAASAAVVVVFVVVASLRSRRASRRSAGSASVADGVGDAGFSAGASTTDPTCAAPGGSMRGVTTTVVSPYAPSSFSPCLPVSRSVQARGSAASAQRPAASASQWRCLRSGCGASRRAAICGHRDTGGVSSGSAANASLQPEGVGSRDASAMGGLAEGRR